MRWLSVSSGRSGAEPSRRLLRVALLGGLIGLAGSALAGNQQYEPLAASVQAALHAAVSDRASPEPVFASEREKTHWLGAMSARLARYIEDEAVRVDLLKTVHYEATRAGLDPQLVLSVIQVESAFRKYAVSKASARGFMQVMPFWASLIGDGDDNLFHVRTNLRYGCTILRHYLDIEHGDLFRALGRYNGSLGKARYPNLVLRAWRTNWTLEAESLAASADR